MIIPETTEVAYRISKFVIEEFLKTGDRPKRVLVDKLVESLIYTAATSDVYNITNFKRISKTDLLKYELRGTSIINHLINETFIFRMERSWRIGVAMYRGRPTDCPCCGPVMF